MNPILASAKGNIITAGIEHHGIGGCTCRDQVATFTIGVDELCVIGGLVVDIAAEVDGFGSGCGVDNQRTVYIAGITATTDAENAIIIIKIAIGPG